jgi:hypothetical protein
MTRSAASADTTAGDRQPLASLYGRDKLDVVGLTVVEPYEPAAIETAWVLACFAIAIVCLAIDLVALSETFRANR